MPKKKTKELNKYLITALKILWVPALLIVALSVGLFVGYDYASEGPGTGIFSRETWNNFFNLIRTLQ